MRIKERITKNEEAVSPVIGVILMVAITVILAAVIAAFVFGLGGEVKSTPKAQLIAKDSVDGLSNTTADNAIDIQHKGGDSILTSEMKFILKGNDGQATPVPQTYTLTWDGTSKWIQDDGATTPTVWVETTTGAGIAAVPGDPVYFDVGETITIKEAAGELTRMGKGAWTVQIVHSPSNAMILDAVVTVV